MPIAHSTLTRRIEALEQAKKRLGDRLDEQRRVRKIMEAMLLMELGLEEMPPNMKMADHRYCIGLEEIDQKKVTIPKM